MIPYIPKSRYYSLCVCVFMSCAWARAGTFFCFFSYLTVLCTADKQWNGSAIFTLIHPLPVKCYIAHTYTTRSVYTKVNQLFACQPVFNHGCCARTSAYYFYFLLSLSVSPVPLLFSAMHEHASHRLLRRNYNILNRC